MMRLSCIHEILFKREILISLFFGKKRTIEKKFREINLQCNPVFRKNDHFTTTQIFFRQINLQYISLVKRFG